MNIQRRSGQIIVLEGLDKSGKTTQTNMLFDYFENKNPGKVFLISFPDYSTQIGKLVRDFLDGRANFSSETFHMLLAANRREKKELIKYYLENGNTILMNRYYHSNLAYGIANGISKEWLLNLDEGMPKEDITVLLDVDPKISQSRVAKNNFEADVFEKDKEFLDETRINYLNLAREYGWAVVESHKSKEEVFDSILRALGE
jgi:dTMP kinase